MEIYPADSDGQLSSGPSPLAELTEAIKRVRTEGVNKPGLRIPAPLSRALGIDSNPQAAKARVRQALLSYAVQLPLARRLAFLCGAGFRQDIQGSSGQRVTKTAEALGLSRRNVYLQIHRASEAIAAELLRAGHVPTLGDIDFVTASTGLTLDYRSGPPSIRIARTITAMRDGLQEVDDHFYFPDLKSGSIAHHAIEGCQASAAQHETGAVTVKSVFAEPLHVGESHSFTVTIILPHRESLAPMLVFCPAHSHQRARVAIHFGAKPPRLVERLDRAWTPQTANPDFPATPIPVAGDPVVVEFQEMERGWDYGVRWFW